jgi:hypothetical protein
MLAAKSFPSVCLSCRFSLAASHLRNAQRLQSRGAAAASLNASNYRSRYGALQRKTFATTAVRGSTGIREIKAVAETEDSAERIAIEETLIEGYTDADTERRRNGAQG